MCKKNLEKNGIYWKIRNHVVLHCEDFDEKNNIPFTVYNKKPFKEKRISKEGEKYSIDGFKKVQLIKGICNFDTEEIQFDEVQFYDIPDEEIKEIVSSTKDILSKEILQSV